MDRPHNVLFDCYAALVVEVPNTKYHSIIGIQFFKSVYKDDFGVLQPSGLVDPETYYVYAMDLIPINKIRKFESLKPFDIIKVVASGINYQVLSNEENVKKNSLVANPVTDRIVRIMSSKTMKIDTLKAWQHFIVLTGDKEPELLEHHNEDNNND